MRVLEDLLRRAGLRDLAGVHNVDGVRHLPGETHRVRHDHSPVFWQMLALARPTFEGERAWLSEHGSELLEYRVPERIAA